MDRTPTLSQKFLAEMLGTSFLTWIGAGSITAAVYLLNGAKPALAFSMADLGMIALAFAFAIAAMVYTIGHISGCHINPAVTLSLAVTKRISWSEAGVYWIAQILGGMLGALFIALGFGWTAAAQTGLGATDFGAAISLYGTGGGWIVAIAMETIGTFFLLMVVMGTAVDGRAPSGWAGLIIGLMVAGEIFAFGPITNVALNPARALGPALLQVILGGKYDLSHLIVYFVGPLLGGVLGTLTYDFMTRAREATASKAAGDLQVASV
ncbi:MAG TPA: MIP/aquaporin family protein [Ktedonobacteraceae bacterium]|nr:MIP/aquaporin family protein [Ktedonobacteraceae bacterium]